MNVGHQWHLAVFAAQFGVYASQILCFAHALCGKAHQFAASRHNAFGLRHRSSDVVGVGVGHRLNAYRRIATDCYVSYLYCSRFAAFVVNHFSKKCVK